MKRSKRFVLGMTLMVLSFMVVLVGCKEKAAPATDFAYELTEDGAGIKITKYTGKGGALVIPATIEDMPVTEIEGAAFAFNGTITSVVVPDSVVVIGMGAFQDCNGLTKATLPNGLKVIEIIIFAKCRKLTSVNLPSSLESIGASAFSDCGELTDLIIPETLTSVKWIGDSMGTEISDNNTFRRCGKLPIKTRQAIQALGYTGDF